VPVALALRRTLAPAGSTIFLDAGTTCLALARLLADRRPLAVATRGLEAALLLARTPGLRVIMVGGQVQPLSHGVAGALSEVALGRLAFDIAFLGADILCPDRGLGEPTVEETYVKELVAGRSGRVVLLADSSKFVPANAPAWARIGTSWTVLTDEGADTEVVATFASRGITVVPVG
jgi:DeoR/GlpR family transcriptional regulator of sugar metabolism